MSGSQLPADGFTNEQRRAVRSRDVSVSLSAGAGCGKTFVLIERFLDYFRPGDPQALGPADLRRLVAITFTERAAREMRERIRKVCYDRLKKADGGNAEYWSQLLRELDAARISTIHSFCAALLRSNAVEAGLDPAFEVLEQSQADTLLSQAVEDVLRAQIAGRRDETLALAARFEWNSLNEMLRHLTLQSAGHDLEDWLAIDPDDHARRWAEFHRVDVLPSLVRQVAELPEARVLVELLRQHVPTNATMRSRRAVLLDVLPKLAAVSGSAAIASNLEQLIEHARVEKGGGASAWHEPHVYEQFMHAATEVRKYASRAQPLVEFDLAAAREAAIIGREVLRLAHDVSQTYTETKRRHAALDFDDLLVRASQLLTDPAHDELRRRIASQIDLLLVDEFQDTDPLQVEMVMALCSETAETGKLFFVGDHKQSIYRFRGADPRVFRQLREQTPPAGRLSLTLNFRSQPAILQFVNALFWDDLGDDYEPLRASRAQISPTPSIEFLLAPPAADAPNKDDRPAQHRREAEWIARRIRSLLAAEPPMVRDADSPAARPGLRATRPGDIAILFRALTNIEIYEEALRRHGIDYYLVGGHAFYAQQEVFDIVNLLRTLCSPTDLVCLAGVLRSGFFSLADETIFWLAQHPGGLAAGLAADELSEAIGLDEQRQVRFAAATLAELSAQKDRLPVCELISLAMTRTGYDAALAGEFLGQRKVANLRKLIEQARGFERPGEFGLWEFIGQLSEFVSQPPKEALAAVHAEDANVVRLMSVHQAKGLEFPIVIVADMDGPTNNRFDPAHFDRHLGPLVKPPEDVDRQQHIGGYGLWKVIEAAEQSAELNRLLYVAATRAADHLILSGGIVDLHDPKGPWLQLVARRFDLTTGRLRVELPATEQAPEIRVTLGQPPLAGDGGWRATRADLEAALVAAEAAGDTVRPRPEIEPIPPDLAARREFSFSRLAPALRGEVDLNWEYDESDATSHDPQGLGHLVHAMLEALDFREPEPNLAGLARLLANRKLSCDEDTQREAAELVRRFLVSPRASQLAAAAQRCAEVEFLLAWPDGADGAHVSLNGVIDCLYQDSAGEWHIVDFKTNRIPTEGVAALAAQYELQMLVYAAAVQQSLGVSPRSVTLHFLRDGSEHEFAWGDAASARLGELLAQGIAGARRPAAAAPLALAPSHEVSPPAAPRDRPAATAAFKQRSFWIE